MNIIYHFRVKGVGPERVHISGIADAFENLGHKVTFVSPTDINPLKTGDVAPEKGALRNLLYFFADKTPQVIFELMEIAYNIMAIKKLKKQIYKKKPEYIYERYAFYCFTGIYLAKRTGIPIALEVNEVGGFDRVRPQKLVKLSKLFEKYIFSNANVIVTVSEFLKEQIISRGGKRDSIIVVPNGVDKRLFDAGIDSDNLKQKYNTRNKKIIGFVGYLVHWHRLDLLLETFAKIRNNYPDTVLMLVGDGILRNELESLSKKLRIDDALIITGRVNHSEIPNYIDMFDIAVIPNSNEYRSPIKMFEYMAMGKAIIAPDQPPILSVIENETTGFIFKNGNIDDLTKSIEMALDSEEKCQNVGRNAKKLVFDKFTWDAHATAILNYSNLSPDPTVERC